MSWLITGASKGLGLETVKQLVKSPEVTTIIATARGTPTAELQSVVAASNGKVHIVPLETTSEQSAQEAAKKVSEILDGKLDVLVNNAAISSTTGKIEKMTMDDLLFKYKTNVGGTLLVTQAFLPLLRAGNAKKIAMISSTMGSIGLIFEHQAPAPEAPAYKISKAALNYMMKQLSIELDSEGFTVFSISPGWLKTNLGGSGAWKTPDMGARSVVKITSEAGRDANGTFVNEDGKTMPW